MALRDQPYLPLYIQDVLTDEKLMECSAESHGVYFRLMCILHKQDKYGKLILKQKYKQKASKFENFASMLAKPMPFDRKLIAESLHELDNELVITVENDFLFQKRMIKDGEISEKRAKSGSKGGKKRKKISKPLSKSEANSENEDEIVSEIKDDNVKEEKFRIGVLEFTDYTPIILNEFCDYWTESDQKGKMRWEKETTWDTKRRLGRWVKNNKNGTKVKTGAKDYGTL